MLWADLYHFSNDILLWEGILLLQHQITQKRKSITFKNNVPFINCISKINGVLIDNAEDLESVMPMYNFFECSKNYTKITCSLWNYFRDEPSDPFCSYSESINTRHVLQEVLTILVLMMMVMIQIKLVKIKLKVLFY